MNQIHSDSSPRWSSTTKVVVAITLAALFIYLLYRFQYVLGPLLFSILLAYLLHPLAGFLHNRLRLSWRLAVTLLYLFLLLAIIGMIAWGGLSLVEPLQSLTAFLQKLVADLPRLLNDLTAHPVMIGPFTFDFSRLQLSDLWSQLQGVVSPLLSNIGSLLGSIASGAANTITWTFFTILVAYFITAESRGARANLVNLRIPKYQEDIARIGRHLALVWKSYIRGQLIVILITLVVYSAFLAALGVRYFIGLALLAGLARFVPYVGPAIAWTVYGLVPYFQGTTLFGLQPITYALLVVAVAVVVDFLIDNFVSPKVLAETLNVHPAGVLIMVVIGAQLIGFLGLLLAAPILASLRIFFRYILRKLTDQDPWEGYEEEVLDQKPDVTLRGMVIAVQSGFRRVWNYFSRWFSRAKNR